MSDTSAGEPAAAGEGPEADARRRRAEQQSDAAESGDDLAESVARARRAEAEPAEGSEDSAG